MATPDIPAREHALKLRQWPTIEGLAAYVAAHPTLFDAAVLLGSFAAGRADQLSDIDLILLAPEGGFDAGWARRHELHGAGVLAAWEQLREGLPEVAGYNWVTEHLIVVEALFATPSSGFRLAEPYMVLAGGLPAEVARRPPIARSEMTGWPHAVDLAYSTLKHVLRRGPRPAGGAAS